MKIVVNALSARLGGGQTYLRNLLRHVPDREGLEIVVLAPRDLDLPEHANVRRLLPAWPTDNPVLRSVWERIALPGILRAERAEILFCPGGVVGTRAPDGCRVVTMFRNMIPFDARVRRSVPWGRQRLRNSILYRVMLNSMARADLTIFISDYARALIEKLVRVPNAVTIPHGIGEMFRTHDRRPERPAWLPADDYLLYVSRFDVYKHHYEVVSAYARLPDSLRGKYSLVLAGETNLPEAERVKCLISELGLADRVLIAGAVPYADLPSVYHHAKLVLFASSCENCPNILLEALGSGRPVLSSDVMPMPEFGADAVEYFSPYDPERIRHAMQTVLSDERHAARLAAAAVERSGRYDWAWTASLTWASIFELVDTPARGSWQR